MKRIVLLIIILIIPFNVYALEIPELYSDKVIIYDLTNDYLIYEKNSEEQTSIASLTKILTIITALENINNLNEEIIITSEMLNNIFWDASVAGLQVGDKVTYLDLIYGTILPSGADAAQVLALNLSPTIEDYVNKMNFMAEKIGLTNSHFVNTSGLDTPNQYSTAKDVLALLKYSLENPYFKEVFMTKEYTMTNGLNVKTTLYSYNKKLNMDISRILGSKSGRTGNAGLCLASLISFKNHDILIITIGAPNENSYNLVDALTIIDYLDYNYVIPFPINDVNETAIINAFNNLKEEVIEPSSYKLIIFCGISLILFPILVIPHKKSKKRKKGFN